MTLQPTAKVILLTGASSGIGAATVRLLCAQGHRLLIGARRTERLQALAESLRASGGEVHYCTLDVTQAQQVQAFAQRALQLYGRIDVMINNAGIMPLSPLAALKLDEWQRMLDVNVSGVLHGIAAVLPTLQRQGSGQVINISSIGGLTVVPTAAVYCATKFAVRAISDGLRQEHPYLRVTCVYPGVVESELADSISDPGAAEAMRQFRQNALPPEAIAQAIAHVINQPEQVDSSEIVVRPTGGF
ncbi:SDR family oxidoreductase [Pseudomonas sp. 5P_3.1_Bac2]|uniref:SDR family oxidoreductase n=1 Tax=Pseudomonas sp. 5P_3.1_Bac2 TaxID=2971617 RepID=UPI0021C5E364|nr:SDR family oxidoreductase [Pseudomonas sp. 5P_3.1_Bac2]MCU1719156.1 SDR family oxidoreductase [Pseudomonas sp. 5P_3.1_Bac2]